VRERILRATFALIGREGMAALSNRRIVAEAGVSLGSLTYHFASQEELLRESLCLFVEEEVARMEAIAADIRARCPSPEQIAVEVQQLAAESAVLPERTAELELHLRAARDPALRDASRRCFVAYEGVAAAALEALGVPDPTRNARTVVAVISGLGLQWKGSGRDDAAGLADALLTIVRGARAGADSGSRQDFESDVRSDSQGERLR
jgi:DNA-binding transcriptional regulator YbjK